MKSVNILKRSVVIAALVLSGIAVSQARANQVIFSFTPAGDLGSSTHIFTMGGLSITATSYSCGGLCANNPTMDYSSNTQPNLYDNSDGLGLSNNRIGTKYEIPNNEFVQVDLSSIRANNRIDSIQYKMMDIVTAWSSYGSSTKGELEGAGGVPLVTNKAYTALQTISSPTFNLYSFLAGTNCDVVLNEIVVNYTPTQTPEPATLVMTGLALLGIGGIIKKARKKA